MCDGEGKRGSARHAPARAQMCQLDPQHLHHHVVVQGQVEVVLVGELQGKPGQVGQGIHLHTHRTTPPVPFITSQDREEARRWLSLPLTWGSPSHQTN